MTLAKLVEVVFLCVLETFFKQGFVVASLGHRVLVEPIETGSIRDSDECFLGFDDFYRVTFRRAFNMIGFNHYHRAIAHATLLVVEEFAVRVIGS